MEYLQQVHLQVPELYITYFPVKAMHYILSCMSHLDSEMGTIHLSFQEFSVTHSKKQIAAFSIFSGWEESQESQNHSLRSWDSYKSDCKFFCSSFHVGCLTHIGCPTERFDSKSCFHHRCFYPQPWYELLSVLLFLKVL